MSRRMGMWTIIAAGLLTLIIASSCAPSSVYPETEREVVVTKVVEVEKEAITTKVVEVEKVVSEAPPALEPDEITVRVWAADDFEKQAIEAMVDRFRELYPQITVHLTVVAPGGAR